MLPTRDPIHAVLALYRPSNTPNSLLKMYFSFVFTCIYSYNKWFNATELSKSNELESLYVQAPTVNLLFHYGKWKIQ